MDRACYEHHDTSYTETTQFEFNASTDIKIVPQHICSMCAMLQLQLPREKFSQNFTLADITTYMLTEAIQASLKPHLLVIVSTSHMA